MDEEYGPEARPAKRRRIDRRRIDAAAFRSALLGHFDRHHRPLPWRTNRNPYRVMVSEFMLQQTRVETVGPYYARWLGRFPDWLSLAEAPLDDVLLEWRGLGYYARARNLHRTARAVRERHGGELPDDHAALRALPGVGEYTAAAVASIAFGKPVPAVDGNVRRVLARLLDMARPTPARLRREAARLLDPERPGDHNEAMMELGATICRARTPRCEECPVAAWCAALQAGTVGERPARPRRRPVPQVHCATLVAIDPAGRILLAKRPEKGLLAGMWEFPSVEVRDAGEGALSGPSAIAALALQGPAASGLGLIGRPASLLAPVRHAFTHLRATYHPVVVRCGLVVDRDPRGGADPERAVAHRAQGPAAGVATHVEHAWIRPAEMDAYALPAAQQRIARLAVAWMRNAGAPDRL